MPHYYFHLRFRGRLLRDDEGVELADRAAARQEALAVVRDLAAGKEPNGFAGWFLQVEDRNGSFLRLPMCRPGVELVATSYPHDHGTTMIDSLKVTELVAEAVALAHEFVDDVQRILSLIEQDRQLRG